MLGRNARHSRHRQLSDSQKQQQPSGLLSVQASGPALHNAQSARTQTGVATRRPSSQATGLAFISCCTAPRSVQPLPLRSYSLLPSHPAVELPAACRKALPSMRTAAGLCAPAVTEEAPRARLCETEGRHRDGRSPSARKPRPAWVSGRTAARENA